MKNTQRANRRLELEYLVKLYQFYEDNHYYLMFNDDFKKVLEDQEKKIAHLFNSIINENKGEN